MPDETAPMTIKAVPIAARKRAVEAAGRQDETMGEWMTRAITRQAEMEAGNAVLPPAIRQPGPEPDPAPPPLDLAGLGAALGAITGAYQAAGHKPPLALAREAKGLLEDHIRCLRGKPPRRQRPAPIGRIAGPPVASNGALSDVSR
jgi:hypothetical protein